MQRRMAAQRNGGNNHPIVPSGGEMGQGPALECRPVVGRFLEINLHTVAVVVFCGLTLFGLGKVCVTVTS